MQAKYDLLKHNYDKLAPELLSKSEEMGILRAKINLDMINLEIKLVSEYPDLVEENNSLYEQLDKV